MTMDFHEAVTLYVDIVRRFEKIEQRPWGVEGAMMDLAMQVGHLANCVMSQEKYV